MFFSKWHALGNDFVLISPETPKPSRGLIRALGDRKTGIGFDQLLLLGKSKNADFSLKFFNADGSQAEMCGNGLRAAALYVWSHRKHSPRSITFETAAGIRTASKNGQLIEIDMGVPRALAVMPKAGSAVEIGNPHFVVFLDRPLSPSDLEKKGKALSTHTAFKKGTNVEFAVVKNKKLITVQVYERGVGVTDACGSGAVAVAFAAIENGYVDTRVGAKVEIKFKRGSVFVSKNESQHYSLIGDAHFVFDGNWRPE